MMEGKMLTEEFGHSCSNRKCKPGIVQNINSEYITLLVQLSRYEYHK